jgi:hypothetical protein
VIGYEENEYMIKEGFDCKVGDIVSLKYVDHYEGFRIIPAKDNQAKYKVTAVSKFWGLAVIEKVKINT